MSFTIAASVTIPEDENEIVTVNWQLDRGRQHTSSITKMDMGETSQYLVQYATRHLYPKQGCHGIVLKYNSTNADDGKHSAGIMVWEMDFDDAPIDDFTLPVADVFTEEVYNKRYDEATETAIQIIHAAGYFQPEEHDDVREEVGGTTQSHLMAAMMRSDKISKTLFAAINDHIRLIDLGRYAIPTGADDDPVLVCTCGEAFDQIWTARDHTHTEDEVADPSAEFEFRISTRGEAF